MINELGRGPVDFLLVEVKTALEEKVIDLPLGARGFRAKDRANTAVLRVSNIKGEVKKATTADPITGKTAKPKFWTVPAATQFEEVMTIRNMQNDATEGDGTPLGDQAAGTILEQRYYITSEAEEMPDDDE